MADADRPALDGGGTAALMQALHMTGAALLMDPLAGLSGAAATERLTALADPATLPEGKIRRIALLPAAGLYDLPTLGSLPLHDAAILRLETADIPRAILRALRHEAWILAGRAEGQDRSLPIPAEADFRPNIELRRFNNMIHEVQIGRTILDAALEGCAPRRLTFDAAHLPDPAIPGLPPLSAPRPEPLSDLIQDPAPVIAAIKAERIPCAGVDLPPLPGLNLIPATPLKAFVCGRNIFPYLPVLANKMQNEGVPLIYIDNGSEDGSDRIAAELLGQGIAELHHLPYDGAFSVEAQLRMKQQLIAQHAPRWVLNMDADEIIEHRTPGRGLLDIIDDVEDSAYNAVNFQEFVFLPKPDEDFAGRDYPTLMRRYYMFEPMPYRLLRMWRHGIGLSNLDSAGHRLSGPVRIAPVSHNLRHYIALSEEAARRKYVGRVFSAQELARKWHANRVGITAEDIRLPRDDVEGIQTVPKNNSKDFNRTQPLSRHWWTWRRGS